LNSTDYFHAPIGIKNIETFYVGFGLCRKRFSHPEHDPEIRGTLIREDKTLMSELA